MRSRSAVWTTPSTSRKLSPATSRNGDRSPRRVGSSASSSAANVASPSPRTVTSTSGCSRKNVSQSPVYFGVLGPPWIVMFCGFAAFTIADSSRLRFWFQM